MIEELKKGFGLYFIQQPLNIRLILILTISIFLPFYVTVLVIFATVFFFVKNENMFETILRTPYIKLFALLGFLLLLVPLIYRNYPGFGCAVLLIIFLALEFYISSIMTHKLFNLICSVCCAMSLICAVIAVIEKLSGLQPRVMALTYNPNFYAYIIELMILVCFYKFVTTEKPVFVFIVAANSIALILTGCRSAWIALLAGLFVFLWVSNKKNLMVIFIIVASALALAINFEPSLLPRYESLDPSVTDRFGIWSGAFNDFVKHPIFGRGLLAFYQVTGNPITPHAHNMLLDLLECTGIVGTAIFSFFLGSIIKQLINSFKRGNEQVKARVALCGAVIAATLIHGITDMPVMGIQTGLLFFMVLAIRPNLAYEMLAEKTLNSKRDQNDKIIKMAYMTNEKIGIEKNK